MRPCFGDLPKRSSSSSLPQVATRAQAPSCALIRHPLLAAKSSQVEPSQPRRRRGAHGAAAAAADHCSVTMIRQRNTAAVALMGRGSEQAECSSLVVDIADHPPTGRVTARQRPGRRWPSATFPTAAPDETLGVSSPHLAIAKPEIGGSVTLHYLTYTTR